MIVCLLKHGKKYYFKILSFFGFALEYCQTGYLERPMLQHKSLSQLLHNNSQDQDRVKRTTWHVSENITSEKNMVKVTILRKNNFYKKILQIFMLLSLGQKFLRS